MATDYNQGIASKLLTARAGSTPKKSSSRAAYEASRAAKPAAVKARKAAAAHKNRKIQLSKMPAGRGMEELKKVKDSSDRKAKAAEAYVASRGGSEAKKQSQRKAQLKGMGKRGKEATKSEIESGIKSIEARRESFRGRKNRVKDLVNKFSSRKKKG